MAANIPIVVGARLTPEMKKLKNGPICGMIVNRCPDWFCPDHLLAAEIAFQPLNLSDAGAFVVRQRHRPLVMVRAALIAELIFRTFCLEAVAALLVDRIALDPKLVALVVIREGGLHCCCECCEADERSEELRFIFHDDLLNCARQRYHRLASPAIARRNDDCRAS
jgi:hypothetical protein